MKLLQMLGSKKRPDDEAGYEAAPPPAAFTRRPFVDPVSEAGATVRTGGRDYAVSACVLTENDRDIDALTQWGADLIEGLYKPFNPDTDTADYRVLQNVDRLMGQRVELEDDLKREDTLIRTLREALPPRPRAHNLSGVVPAAAICVYGLGFGASIVPLFLRDLDDPVLAWLAAIFIGLAMGSLITFSVLGFEEKENN